MEEKQIYDLANCQSQNKKNKQVKPVKIVNYNINATNCNVLAVMQ